MTFPRGNRKVWPDGPGSLTRPQSWEEMWGPWPSYNGAGSST